MSETQGVNTGKQQGPNTNTNTNQEEEKRKRRAIDNEISNMHQGEECFHCLIKEGVHPKTREKQFFGEASIFGLRVKLIPDSRQMVKPKKGEFWSFAPTHSPNGHIVFGQLCHKVREVDGTHTAVKQLSDALSRHKWIQVRNPGETRYLSSASIEVGLLSINVVNREGVACGSYTGDAMRTEVSIDGKNIRIKLAIQEEIDPHSELMGDITPETHPEEFWWVKKEVGFTQR